jgi:hypothetical protein
MSSSRLFVPAGSINSGASAVLFRDDRTFDGSWSNPSVPLLIFKDAKPGMTTVSPHGGPVASDAPVQLIFWGAWWNSPEGASRMQMLQDRVEWTVSSRYFSQLAQYGVGLPTFRGATVIDNPAPPMNFATTDDERAVVTLIWFLITSNFFPHPNDERIAFVVFMPKGFTESVKANGAHTWELYNEFSFGGFSTFGMPEEWIWVAWIRFFDTGIEPNDDDPENTNRTVSHELVEMLTDPQGDGWYPDDDLEREIADAAWSGNTRQAAWVNGAFVSSYWSNAHSANVIPIDRDYAARISGSIEVTGQHEIDRGTFRPDANDRILCGHVDVCCIEDRDYDWWVIGRDEVAWLDLQTHRYRRPAVSWSINGQAIAGNSNVSLLVRASRYKGRSLQTLDETVSLSFETKDTSLTLRANSLDANFDVEVSCTVHDNSIKGTLATDVVASPSVTVGFVGAKLSLDEDYTRQRDACNEWLKEQFDKVKRKLRVGRPRPGEPIELGPEVLVELPAWTRIENFERARDALTFAAIARETLPPDIAARFAESLLVDSPELAHTIESMGMRQQRD